MIVREKQDMFILIRQHDHARISGDIAKHIISGLFSDGNFKEVVLATYEHDRGWIALDQSASWNDQTESPHSFMNYPLSPKLSAYKQGLDDIESINKYAGLICSLHYSSFFNDGAPSESSWFIKHEDDRQKRLIASLNVDNIDMISSDLEILQFCDVLSLYVCINEPGVSKDKESHRYKNGISYSENINPKGRGRILTRWLNNHEIAVDGFPFDAEFESIIKYKEVSKNNIREMGMERAYIEEDWKEHKVIFKKSHDEGSNFT